MKPPWNKSYPLATPKLQENWLKPVQNKPLEESEEPAWEIKSIYTVWPNKTEEKHSMDRSIPLVTEELKMPEEESVGMV